MDRRHFQPVHDYQFEQIGLNNLYRVVHELRYAVHELHYAVHELRYAVPGSFIYEMTI